MKSEPAFVTKILVPRRRPDTVRRARLLDMLRRGRGGELVALRAPAGFGKTTLLVDLAHEAGGGVCWVSLDEWDRDTATFLQYLRLSVLRRFGSAGAKSARALSARDPRLLLGELTTRIANHDQDTWIFLDDFHCLEGSEKVLGLLDYFAQRLPLNCRLFLASRTQPALLSLARLRLEGRAMEFGAAELAFTADEIKQYYSSARDQDISHEEAQRILNSTQGWPAGVALFTDPATLGEERQETSVPLSEYLAAEIFDRLSEGLRRFLLRTSVFDTLEVSGCDAILHEHGAEQLLASLERQNVPIMRIQGAVAEYRVHPLFRDFLRSKLRLECPEMFRSLNEDAGAWQADRGRSSEAIWHFAQAQDWDQVATLILEEAPRAYKAGRWDTVTSWLDVMPANELQTRPNLRLWEARILARLGQADEALRVVDEAVGGLKESNLVAAAEFETIRATALRVKGDVGWALSSCQRAVDLAAKGNSPIDVLAEARKQLGLILIDMGSFSEAAQEHRSALNIYEQRGDVEETAFVSGCLGSALGSLGKLAESVTYMEQARRQWRKVGNAKELSWVLNNLAMTYCQMGQIDLARELFIESLSKARDSGNQRIEAYALISLADIDRQSDDLHLALERYEQALAIAADLGEMRPSTHALTGLAHTYRQMGDAGRAEVLARQALASAEERGNLYEQGLAQIALGRVWRQQGNLNDATSVLSTAVTLFDGVNAKKELAEALFYLADASLPIRQGRSLLRITLERLAAVAGELGHDHFLVEATREVPAVAEYGGSRRISGGFYRELLRRSAQQRSQVSRPARDDTMAADCLPVVEAMALGEVEVRMDGRKVLDLEWESEKSKELFFLLLTHERPLRRDEIVAALWPEAGGSRASSAFHSTLYRVRRALYAECVVESGGAYALNPRSSFLYDVREFERLSETARAMAEDDPSYVDALRAAIDLYRGPFVPNLEGEWSDACRLRLEERFLEVAAKLADRLLQQGDHAGAAQACQRLLEYDPYNEAACYKLMKAHAASGDHEAALHVYRHYREVLETDLGEQPAEAIVQLYSEVRDRLGPTVRRPP
jgi:ATP/maltotriose-dependent transcriptional regulator MalT/two-component SAPR family response regulator